MDGDRGPDSNGREEGADELERAVSTPSQIPAPDPDPGVWNKPGVRVPVAQGGSGGFGWILPDVDAMCLLTFPVLIEGQAGQAYTLRIDWGDGSTREQTVYGGSTYSVEHHYAPNLSSEAITHGVHMELDANGRCEGFIARHFADAPSADPASMDSK
jgi:hypothetical protein